MKVAQEIFAELLYRASAAGTVPEFVLEKDGSVAVSNNNELIAVTRPQAINFGVPVAITNLPLVLKAVQSMNDEMLLIEVAEKKLTILGKDERYEFRTADPSAVESLMDKIEKIDGRKKEMVGFPLMHAVVQRIARATSVLSADRLSLHAAGGMLNVVVFDYATESTAVVEVCKAEGDFKMDFNAKLVTALLGIESRRMDALNENDKACTIYVGKKQPLFVELPGEQFLYMVSFLADTEDIKKKD